MTARRKSAVDQIWNGVEPFTSELLDNLRVDFQGWGSDNPYLTRVIDELRPQTIVEVGVWKGGSVITMAERLKFHNLDGVVIAIDTWLGSSELWLQAEWFEHLKIENGYPTLYKTFASNIIAKELGDYVVPFPLDSLNAASVLMGKQIFPDVIHLDGAHEFESVISDLRVWWPLLREGGVLIGDDYYPNGDTWASVRQAFHHFFNTNQPLENFAGKCWIRKTGDK